MRFLHTRKRSRPYGATGGVAKRRRFLRRRRPIRRRGSSYSTTSRGLNASNALKIRARKLSKRAWRSGLWRETRYKTHYRSILSVFDTTATPNNTTSLIPYVSNIFTQVAGAEFWHTAGGLQDPSFGEIPSFAGAGITNDPVTIIMRGGRIWITTSLGLGAVDTVKVRVQIAFPKAQLRTYDDAGNNNTLGIPGAANGWLGTAAINVNGPAYALGTPRPSGWDLTCAPDYNQYFYKPILDKAFDLKAGDDYTVYWKVKPVKIDVGPFKDGQGWFPYVFIYPEQQNNSNGAAETIAIKIGFNVSFAVADTLT